MLEKQVKELSLILKNEDIKKYAGDAFWDLIEAVVTADIGSGLSAIKNIKDLIFHIPTVLFWDKMKRYLLGTFSCFEDQVKLSAKFCNDEKTYSEFVKKQIHLINEIDDDKKVDYFAALTRCFLLTDLQSDLYFKLAKYLIMCTPDELEYLCNLTMSCREANSAIVSSLYQYGLFTQEGKEKGGGVDYILSDYAKALKQNSLNFEDSFNGEERRTSYKQLAPLSIAEPATFEEIEDLFKNEEIIIDGGTVDGIK